MRIEQLTFTRFLAAISIVVFHYGKTIFPFNLEFTSFIFKHANIGVSYFFILSGFVMIIAYGTKKRVVPMLYFKNRFARIYPVYLLAIVLFLVYQLIFTKHIDLLGLLLNIFLLQSWVPGYALSFNTPGWSLAVEFFFYLIFPFLFNKIYLKVNYVKIAITILIIWLLSQLVLNWVLTFPFYRDSFSDYHDVLYYSPIVHLNEFLIGNLAGLFYLKRLRHKKMNCDWLVLILIFCTVLLLKLGTGFIFHNGLMAITFVPLIVAVSVNDGFLTKLSNRSIFIFLGHISYGIYILQKPIYYWVTRFFLYLETDHATLQFYTSIIVLILVSAMSYIYIEKPLRTSIKNITLPKF